MSKEMNLMDSSVRGDATWWANWESAQGPELEKGPHKWLITLAHGGNQTKKPLNSLIAMSRSLR